MKAAEILAHVDHTFLKQTATWADIQRICDEAVKYHTATVMVPSSYVPRIVAKYGDALKVATVVGFPNGNCNTAAKIAETAQALADGAQEIDMVINIGMLKAGETDYVTEEIRALKKLCGARVLKVIVETCFLTEEEMIAACHCVTEGGADFIKTSTGFGSLGQALGCRVFRSTSDRGAEEVKSRRQHPRARRWKPSSQRAARASAPALPSRSSRMRFDR